MVSKKMRNAVLVLQTFQGPGSRDQEWQHQEKRQSVMEFAILQTARQNPKESKNQQRSVIKPVIYGNQTYDRQCGHLQRSRNAGVSPHQPGDKYNQQY